MTFTYQLTRGCLALALLGALALAAWTAPPAPARAEASVIVVRAADPAERTTCAVSGSGLRLAMAPTDLRTLGRRHTPDCRA
jgi:hypothetical protein